MNKLQELYNKYRSTQSDINRHLDMLYRITLLCNSVTEFVSRPGETTSAFLCAGPRKLTTYNVSGTDMSDIIDMANNHSDTDFRHIEIDHLTTDIEGTDFLFIDTLHTYEQMKYELKLHGNQARKYLAMHDVVTYGEAGEIKNNKGIWPAITEFVRSNSHWKLMLFHTFNNGLAVFTRES